MRDFKFLVKEGASIRDACLRFAGESDVNRYHRSLSQSYPHSDAITREAIEYTRLAAKRWRYYSRVGEAAESLAQLSKLIQSHPTSEIAFIMVASLPSTAGAMPIGIAYCRRTWCHHLALDFLALHPRILGRGRRVTGAGSGIIYGLVLLAQRLGIARIWGEATANSAAFYEKLMAVRPVADLFVIEAKEMSAIMQRQLGLRNPDLATGRSTGV